MRVVVVVVVWSSLVLVSGIEMNWSSARGRVWPGHTMGI